MKSVDVIISNGPDDPKMCKGVIKTAGELIKAKIPILEICLGIQTLALSLGGGTHTS